jgi:rod shape-determining protein MreC
VRNIFLFIRRYSTLLFFLFLQALSIYFIVSYNKYHQAAFGGTMNKFTGSINKQYNKIEYYFQLSRTNDSLVKANEVLYNKLRSNYNLPDSTNKIVIDSVKQDTLMRYRKFNYMSAKIISNSTTSQSNFIVVYGPNVKSFVKGMGVVGINNDVIGIVTEIDGDYAVVMSLLHKDSHLSGKLFKGGETGTLNWDGKQPNILTLNNVPGSAKVVKGDSIITSGLTTTFPKGIMFGKVIDVKTETGKNNFRITLKTAADFYNVEYVYAIQNIDDVAVTKILEKVKATSK